MATYTGLLATCASRTLNHGRADQQHRIDRVERPLLPHNHVGDHSVGDLRDRVPAHRSVDLLEIGLNLPCRETLRLWRDYIPRQAAEAAVLGDRHRGERPSAITRQCQIDLADLRLDRHRRRPVARAA